METINYQQIKRIHGLLPQEAKHDKEFKEELVYSFSEDSERTSVKQLSFSEANHMIAQLGGEPINLDRKYYQFDLKNQKHKTILSLCHQYGYVKYHKDRHIADLGRLGAWLQGKKSPVKKPMVSMKDEELNKVITALTNMVSKKWK